jgi:transcriptional regulator with XRE-family HTH domain
VADGVQEAVRPLARNVKRLREKRGISLSALAAEASVSKSTLFNLERGQGNPSVDTLWSLARALNVPFATLFLDGDAPIDVLRLEDAPVVGRRGRQFVRSVGGRGFLLRHLLSSGLRGEYEVYCVDLEAGARRDAQPHTPGVLEHAFVVSGRIDVGVEGESAVLEPGDRISFPADRPHHYYALDGPARAFAIIDYPA